MGLGSLFNLEFFNLGNLVSVDIDELTGDGECGAKDGNSRNLEISRQLDSGAPREILHRLSCA